MKKMIIIFFFLFYGSTMYSQSDVESASPTYEKQIGLNFTNFILRFISFQQELSGTPSILVLYKKTKNGKRYRYGVGGRIEWEKLRDEKDFNAQLSLRFGREYPHSIKNWTVYYGWESSFFGSFSQRKFDNNLDEEEKIFTRTAIIGGRILAGIQYKFNKRLSLLTETNYGIFFNYSLLASKRERYLIGSSYSPPVSLILSYHF